MTWSGLPADLSVRGRLPPRCGLGLQIGTCTLLASYAAPLPVLWVAGLGVSAWMVR